MFRTLGLRHVIVLNSRSEVVGIVARAELMENHLHACIGDKWKGHDSKDYNCTGQLELPPFSDSDRGSLLSSTNDNNNFITSDNGGIKMSRVKGDNEVFFGEDDSL